MAGKGKRDNVVAFRLVRRSVRPDAGRGRSRLRSVGNRTTLIYSLLVLLFVGVAAIKIINSPLPPATALRHFVAAPNCAAARAMGLAPARKGQPGYYVRHDRDNDGIACERFPRP